MGVIRLEGIKFHAFHGCLPEEARIGGNYIVDVVIETDLSQSEKTDKLADTLDYCIVYDIVKEQMKIRSKLIEHVAGRISEKLKEKFKNIQKLKVIVTKINPPLNGEVRSVSVEVD
jgi:dihydroneopterin aldolase